MEQDLCVSVLSDISNVGGVGELNICELNSCLDM